MIERVLLEEIVVEIRNGLDAEQVDQPSNGMLPISRIETIWNGTIDFERVKYANVSKKEIDKYALKSGDILFSHINSPEHIGKTGLYRSEQTLIHGINLLLIRVDQEKCYPEYLDYYFKSKNVRALFRARCKKAVNQASLNQSDILALELPLPPLDEQKRIASLLARADRLRGLRRAARRLADSLLQSVFLEMFGHVRANEKKWELAKFEDVCESRLGKMLDEKKQTGKHKRKYLRNFNVQWFQFDLSDIAEMDFDEKDRQEFRLQYGDILMCEGGEVGRCSIWKNQIEECYFQKALHRIRPNPECVKSEYLVHLFWWLAQTGGLGDFTSQVTIAHLTGEKLKELVIPVPPLPLQEEFARVAARVEALRARQAEAERQAEGLFQSLLALSFTEGLAQSFGE
ncbi:MAG: restriction endonuclease subunit S [Chloroflexota bacterium]